MNISQEFFEVLLQTQHMPVEARPGYQRILTERLLRHARAQVPFYRDSGRLDPLFKPSGEIDWDRWHEVPLLTRREAQQNAEALYAEVVPEECGSIVNGYTAGSIGTPLAYRINTLMAAVGSAMMERGFVWAGLPPALKLAWFRNDRDGSVAYPHGQIFRSVIRGQGRQTHYLSVQTPVELQGHWLARVQPDVVVGYPGALAVLARNLPAILSSHPFQLVVCVGEVTTELDRDAIETGFRCPSLDLYSGSEFGPIAVEDIRLGRMLVCEESTLVELLPRGPGYAVGDEAMTEVVITPFYNYAMPLIRYSPGDFAVLDSKPQVDARTLRRIKQVAGRERNSFVMPSGRHWWPTYQNKVLRGFLDYKQIQFAQTAPDRIEIRFASDLSEPIKNAELLHAYLCEATPEPMHITVKRVAEIAQRASGKYEYATCELDPSAVPARIDAQSAAPAAPPTGTPTIHPHFIASPSAPYRPVEAVERFRREWRRTERIAPREIEALQRSLLEPLLRHARSHVPFYRDSGRLDPVVRGDGTIDWDRWRHIPPLTRGEVQKAGTALHAEQLPLDHGHTWVLSTSGSTGEPVHAVHDALSGEAVWTAIYLRDLERHNIDPTQRLANFAVLPNYDRDRSGIRRDTAWSPSLAMMGLLGERLDLGTFLPPAQTIEELLAFRPKYLRSNPIRLELLCNWDRDNRLRELGLDAVIAFTDHVSDQTRSKLTQHLRCKVIDLYASNECGNIATTCPHCGRFHVHAESILLETVDEYGKSTVPGETGWVLLTPLHNYAMPLIRYDQADQVCVGLPAVCPIALPTLDSVVGKEPVVFTFRGEIKVRPFIPPETIARNLGAQIFQVAQVADDRCEFRIVPDRILASEMRLEATTEVLRTRWWKDLQVDYRIMETLPEPYRHRKPATYVCELPSK